MLTGELRSQIDRICFVHVRDVIIHPSGQVDEVFPGTGQVRPDTAIALLHELGYRGAIAPEHLPKVFGERKNEISMAWAAGYGRRWRSCVRIADRLMRLGSRLLGWSRSRSRCGHGSKTRRRDTRFC